MNQPVHTTSTLDGLSNVLTRFADGVRAAADLVREEGGSGVAGSFEIDLAPPPVDAALEEFYEPSAMSARRLGDYREHRLVLLDLMGNPMTRTTKTIASLSMIARAVNHIRNTGERVLVLTPTSGNKGTALRDAVGRALDLGLVSEDELRIVTALPQRSLTKARTSRLAATAQRCRKNPIVLQRCERPDEVKSFAQAFVRDQGAEVFGRTGFRLWNSLNLDNYRVADSVRAFTEHVLLPPVAEAGQRVHAHAVSSAYGLLGYHLGRRVLEGGRYHPTDVPVGRHPQFFIVQQLATPDMVLSLTKGSFSRENIPAYRYLPTTGLHHQETDPSFPFATHSLTESVDPTFYTSRPATSEAFNGIVAEHGGGGIVVSLHECLTRYPLVRALLADSGVALPEDPREVREWSLVKVFTGVMLAADRGLLPAGAEVVVHGSGFYSDLNLPPAPAPSLVHSDDAAEFGRAVWSAATA
ncbi:DUF6002 family protein [Actinosynnema sp. NPDC020468]|uniref:DUF6002 family protein n=1 Tax=Actinosynnema sp. NPDC020468 TaxID=3154488 RepID=UPI0033D72598